MSLSPTVGDQFGSWTIIREPYLVLHKKRHYGRRSWTIARCACGEVAVMPVANLHRSTRCRKCFADSRRRQRPDSPVGSKFGAWTVTGEPTIHRSSCGERYYLPVTCDCGQQREVLYYDLASGGSLSCGCLWKGELAAGYKHGGTHSPLYSVWSGMKGRCLNPSDVSWHRYGGRGITISPLWVNDFPAFRDWAESHGYQRGLEIDRRDNDGNYEPDNCRWVTLQVNQRNKGNRRPITCWGESKIASEWTEDPRCIVSRPVLYSRIIKLGWDPEVAMTTPARYRSPNGTGRRRR